MQITRTIVLVPLLILFVCLSLSAHLPPGFSRTQVAAGLAPTTMALAPDGRIFILEKSGWVRIFRDGELLPDPFLTIEVDNFNERGLSGIAFHPDFEQTHHLYLYYTVPGADHNRVTVKILNHEREVVSLRLFDLPGRLVYERSVETVRGASLFDLDVSRLQAGLYILDVEGLLQIKEQIKLMKN